MIWDQILQDTSAKTLKWTCGSHSDIWSASHSRYSISISWCLPFILRFVVHTTVGKYYLNIGPFKWQKLLGLIRESERLVSEYDIHQAMTGYPNSKDQL